MKEYTMVFKEGVVKALRGSADNSKNNQALIQAQGVMESSGILINYEDLTSLDLTVLGCTFPFPQIFKLTNYYVICTETKIYTYDGSLTLVYTADEGSTWTVADFHEFLVFSNGIELVKHDPITGDWMKFLECSVPQCLCVCDVNGQLFMGGPEVSISAGFLG